MCRGVEEGSSHGSSSEGVDTAVSSVVFCELCGSRAALYCQADDAYLCRKCDKWVHSANILALRHIRFVLCENCQNHTRRYLIGDPRPRWRSLPLSLFGLQKEKPTLV